MTYRSCSALVILSCLIGVGCAEGQGTFVTLLSPPGSISIVRQPFAPDYRRIQPSGKVEVLPTFRAESQDPWQLDMRSRDLSTLDVSGRLADLLQTTFDTRTVWPERLPVGFDVGRIMELGKSPGLSIRELHRQGITGTGVGIAIIDQALLIDHQEYKEQLRLYEEIHWIRGSSAQMHAPAVASIAVGRSVGVAPGADLYFIAEWHSNSTGSGGFQVDLTPLAHSIDRVVEVNRTLPVGRKIRVISISLGINPSMASYDLAKQAIDAAEQEGIYTAFVGSDRFHGLGRDPLSDPERFESYGLGQFWALWWKGEDAGQLYVPMDSRCTAAPNGNADYVFYRAGGSSWTVPWVAGLYALACQVRPDITRETFWEVARATGVPAVTQYGGKEARFGSIIDPRALIAALR